MSKRKKRDLRETGTQDKDNIERIDTNKRTGNENLKKNQAKNRKRRGQEVEQERKESKVTGRSKKKTKVSVLDYFVEAALNKITRGSLDIQGTQFEISYSKVLSEKHKKRVIYIREFPEIVFAGHLELIRNNVYRQLPQTEREQVGIDIIEHSLPNRIRFINNKKMGNVETAFRRQRSQTIIDKNMKEANRRSGTGWNSSRDDVTILDKRIARLNRKIDSHEVIKKHQARGGETLKTYLFIEVTGITLEQVDDVTDMVLGLLADNQYKYAEIFDLENYLKSFGLASLNYSLKPAIDLHPMTMTTEVSAVSQSYTEGIIRSEQGDVYMGHSIESGYPVFASFSESSDGANILMVASSGSGKTAYCKTMALSALNHKGNTYNIIVNDYKGGEWDKLAEIVKNSQVISMGINSPKFVNTLVIPDYKRYAFVKPETAYHLSATFTTKLLAILVGAQDPMKGAQVENICSDIVERTYNMNGVDVRQPSTYVRSQDFNFREALWSAITFITTESSDMELRHGKDLLALVKTSLEYYFSVSGSKNYMFANPVDIDSIMDSKFVVFDYGTQTAGGSGTMLDKEIEASMYQKEFFSSLYSAYNKLKKEYTMEFDEEVQRQLNNPVLMKSLNDKVTGGRSSNKINILIINAVEGLLGGDNPNASAIRGNMNTIILGRVKKSEAIATINYFGLEQAMSRVGHIITSNDKYQNSFLCAINTGKMYDMTVTKMRIPPHLYSTDIYKSKDVEDNKSTVIQ